MPELRELVALQRRRGLQGWRQGLGTKVHPQVSTCRYHSIALKAEHLDSFHSGSVLRAGEDSGSRQTLSLSPGALCQAEKKRN